MLRNLIVFVLVIFAGNTVFGQVGTVRGIVKSDEDGNGVPFAKVVIIGTDKFANTDGDGLFSIPNVPIGPQKIRITATAFTEYSRY